MLRPKNLAFAIFAVMLSVSAFAAPPASPTFFTIDNPGDPTFNQLLGINDSGVISGYFGSGAAGHPNQGYTIAPPYTTFESANFPGSTQTQATGINNGGMLAGFWSNTNTGTDANFGFIREGTSTFTFILADDPRVASTPPVNQLLGINQSKIAVGFYNDVNGAPHGYTYTVATAKFAPVSVGGVSDAATGISNDNMICGFFTEASGHTQGFVKPLSGVSLTTFAVHGSSVTQLLGINDRGIVVGFYVGADALDHGVIYNLATGNVTYVDAPNGTMGTVLNGINNKNEIVGFYTDAAGNTHGVLITGAL